MAKQINTRIQLKYDSLENWARENTELKSGEVAIAYLPPKGDGVAPDAASSAVLMKVGPGKFNDLPYASALAADVYAWAKKSESEFIEWVNTIVEHHAKTTVVEGSTNGTVAVDGVDVKVHGLGTAAYTNSDAYAPADIDTGVHTVELAGGTNNGTLKLTVDGTATDNIAVTGLGDAAYTTIATLNETAKGYADAVEAKIPTSADYGVLSVTGKDAIKVTDGQNPEVTLAFDGSGNVVLSQSETGLKATVDLSAYRLIADDQDTTYGLAYDSEKKVIKLVEGGTDLEIPASDFIADGMLQSVVADKENNTLTFTWNTDGGATVTTVNLTDIADIYTGKNGTTINVAVSNTNEISAEVNPKSITSVHLADELVNAINKDDNTTYTVATTTNKFEFTVTPSEGDVQTVTLNAGALAGKDKVAESDIEGTIAHTKISGLGALATKDSLTAADVGAATAGDITAALEALDSSIEATEGSVLTGVTIADGKLTAKTEKALHEIATTGSIYDIAEGAETSTGSDDEDDTLYLVFNCGSATSII